MAGDAQARAAAEALRRDLWDDVDPNEVLELAERYLDAVPLTAERAILRALVLQYRRLNPEPLVPEPAE